MNEACSATNHVASPPTPAESAQRSEQGVDSLGRRIRLAVLWRSGSQLLAQAIQWGATFLIIRILTPRDYGLFAMTQVVIILLNMLDGFGLASGVIQQKNVTDREIRQLFGMLLVLNGGLALGQFLFLAPAAAAYYGQETVGSMLRVQALMHLTTPFIALPYAVLCRRLDFRAQATANLLASLAAAATGLTGALAGWGVWTLVIAPMVLFAVRAAMLTAAAGTLVRPMFDLRGIGGIARFGGVVAAGQLFWFAQSQADVFIGGHWLGAHRLGIYTTAIFLTQIFVAKILPPLNEVAFSAYARMEGNGAVAIAFARAVRVVMVAAMPFYLGLAATAEPVVLAMLGEKWAEAVPLVRLLALAMPFMTLQVLLAPACDARGRPGIGVSNGAIGAILLTAAFLVGIHWGMMGMAVAWLVAYPPYLAISAARSLPVIGVRTGALLTSLAAPVSAAIGMAAIVTLVDALLPPLGQVARLSTLVIAGALAYTGALWLLARDLIAELSSLARR